MVGVIYMCNHESYVPSRLSPQWLCGNSCTWAHDVRYIYIYIYIYTHIYVNIYIYIYIYIYILHIIYTIYISYISDIQIKEKQRKTTNLQ